jgi:hypothetical protein
VLTKVFCSLIPLTKIKLSYSSLELMVESTSLYGFSLIICHPLSRISPIFYQKIHWRWHIKLLFFFYRKKKLVVSINKNNNKESLCFCILKMFFKDIENLLFIFVLIFFMFSDHFDIWNKFLKIKKYIYFNEFLKKPLLGQYKMGFNSDLTKLNIMTSLPIVCTKYYVLAWHPE